MKIEFLTGYHCGTVRQNFLISLKKAEFTEVPLGCNVKCIACLSALLNWASPDQITHCYVLNIIFGSQLTILTHVCLSPSLFSLVLVLVVYKVLEVPDYKSLTAPPDPCEVSGAVNRKDSIEHN